MGQVLWRPQETHPVVHVLYCAEGRRVGAVDPLGASGVAHADYETPGEKHRIYHLTSQRLVLILSVRRVAREVGAVEIALVEVDRDGTARGQHG